VSTVSKIRVCSISPDVLGDSLVATAVKPLAGYRRDEAKVEVPLPHEKAEFLKSVCLWANVAIERQPFVWEFIDAN